jgi:hypothetical protein
LESIPGPHKHLKVRAQQSARTLTGKSIEESRARSKSLYKTFGYFLSMSQHAVSAEIIPNSAFGIFSPKTEGTKT